MRNYLKNELKRAFEDFNTSQCQSPMEDILQSDPICEELFEYVNCKKVFSDKKALELIEKSSFTKEQKKQLKARYYELRYTARSEDEFSADNMMKDCGLSTMAGSVEETVGLIYFMIRCELKKYGSDGKIIIFSDAQSELVEILSCVACSESYPEIEHMIYLDKSELWIENIKKICSVLSVGVNAKNYRVKYRESSIPTEKFTQRVMPYYVLSSDSLLIISADFCAASYITDRQWVESYRTEYDDLCKNAEYLFEYKKIEEIIDEYDIVDEDICYLQFQPEITQFLDIKDVEAMLKDEVESRSYVFERLERYKRSYIFFTPEGLRDFCERGTAYEYNCFFKPLNMEQRVKLLKKMRTDISINKFNQKNFMLKESDLTIPKSLRILFLREKMLAINFICERRNGILRLNKVDDFDQIIKLFIFDSGAVDSKKTVEKTDVLIDTINELIEKYQG